MDLRQKSDALEKLKIRPKIQAKDLTDEEGYNIIHLKRINTKFGETIIADICTSNGDKAVTFLPPRFADDLDATDLVQLNGGGYKIRCTGMTGRSPNMAIYKEKPAPKRRK